VVHACLKMTLDAAEQRAAPARPGTMMAKTNEECGVLRPAAAAAATAAAQEPETEAPRGGRRGRAAPAEEAAEPERPRRGLRGGGGEETKAAEAPAPTGLAQLPRLEKEMFGPGNCGK